jgi:hypothetical protein
MEIVTPASITPMQSARRRHRDRFISRSDSSNIFGLEQEPSDGMKIPNARGDTSLY